MKNRAGKTVQNLSGEMVYTSFYPQPLPPQPNIEIDTEMQQLLLYVALTRSTDHLTILIPQDVEASFTRTFILTFFERYSVSLYTP